MAVASNFHQTLKDTAIGYLALGWSVIPLWGNRRPDMPKVAAVAWEPFQRRRAGEAELDAWFERQGFAGLGIVTGAVSQLVILDFDDPTLLQAFAQMCPDLLATRTADTRRGQHLYFRVPPTLAVRSQKLDGIDLLAGGCYAVAPPSVIDSFAYTVQRGGQPRTLTQADLTQIDAFLATRRAETPQGPSGVIVAPPRGKTHSEAAGQEKQAFLPAVESAEPRPHASLTADALIHLYRGLTQQMKRNIALFKASCMARDHGWSYAAVVECLADIHALQPARGQHRAESEKSRYREAIATIRSVFRRPPRRPKTDDTGGLYNSIREKLFQLGQTCVVRVLEGLRLAGFKVGQLVTEKQVLHVLRGLVGRRSIRAALQALSPQNEPIFTKISPRYPPQRSAATDLRIANTLNADVSRAKRDKIRGRPSTTFRIPSLEALCKRLGVRPTASDPLTLADLQSARKTRQAAHRELIRRRPGLYLRQWLADRLGVSEATIWRYSHTQNGLQVTPTYTATKLGWHNLSAIPAEDAQSTGTVLEDDTGKRWPALKGIATRLLGQGRAVKLLVQSLSYYAFNRAAPLNLQLERASGHHQKMPKSVLIFAQHTNRLIRNFELQKAVAAPVVKRPSSLDTPDAAERSPLSDAYANSTRKRHRYWKPLDRPENESLAQHVYTALNARSSSPHQRMSLATARRAVDEAGEIAVRAALVMFEQRSQIVNPAGWFTSFLRPARRALRGQALR